MPKLGMEPVRKAQLVDATLESVSKYGFQNTTVATICKIAKLSPGIISHYFGGKQQLIEASIWYLIYSLRSEFLKRLEASSELTPKERLYLLIDSNFSDIQTTNKAAAMWLAFWSQAMHDPALARFQQINERRLYSNIHFSVTKIVNDGADQKSHMLAAMIDGLWMRASLDKSMMSLEYAANICKRYVDSL